MNILLPSHRTQQKLCEKYFEIEKALEKEQENIINAKELLRHLTRQTLVGTS